MVVCYNFAMGMLNPFMDCSDQVLAKLKVSGAKDKTWYFVVSFKGGKKFNIVCINHLKGDTLGVVHYYKGIWHG